METSHVKLCIRDDLVAKNHFVTDEIINKVLNELHFIPEDSKLYSKSGCKRVSEKVNMVIEEL
jgi:chaperonin cofactor prefoldin